MPTLRITIKMDNAAFENESGSEVARILRQLAGDFDGRDLLPGERSPLLDVNGNLVGEEKVTR